MNNSIQNGWNEWSKHVLKELERLNDGQREIKNDLQDVKNSMTRIAVLENQVKELKEWREDVSEVYSPTQFSEDKKSIEELKAFKTKAITVFVVVQMGFGIVMALISVM